MGENLEEVREESVKSVEVAKRLGQTMLIERMNMVLQFISFYQGEEEFNTDVTGKYFEESTILVNYVETNNQSGILALNVFKLIYLYLFEQIELAYNLIPTIEKYSAAGMSNPVEPLLQHYVSITLATHHPKLGAIAKLASRHKIRKYMRKLNRAASHCPENYRFRYLSVKAEYYRVLNDFKKGSCFYNQALKNINRNEYCFDRGILLERLASLHLQNGETYSAGCFVNDAVKVYRQWGSKPKVEMVTYRNRYILQEWQQNDKLSHSNNDTHKNFIGDSQVLMKTAHALSKEIVLSKIIDRLMSLLIENAGAEKALLILKRNNNGDSDLFIEAGISLNYEIEEQYPLNLYESKQLPAAIIRYVAKTKENVLLDDAENESTFSHDQYIQSKKPKSIICAPLLKQNDLVGLLYLENNQASGVFNPDRVEVLKFICSQAAISIENAKLYGDLHASEDKYRSIFENSTEGIFRLSISGEFIAANKALAQILGHTNPEKLTTNKIKLTEFLRGKTNKELISRLHNKRAESPRVYRRQFYLSHATRADSACL